MILALPKDLEAFVPSLPGLDAAIRFLENTDLDALPDGRCQITPDNTVFALVARAAGRGRAAARLEAHRGAVDLQMPLDAPELIGWRPTSACTPKTEYDPENDIQFFHDSPWAWLPLAPGTCALFFPEDAHAPLAGTEPLRKIVIKIKTPRV